MTLVEARENPNILLTVSLLTAYCFDLRGLAPTQLINEWLGTFSALWIRLAVIEALYLGRYKAISVEHLLQYWALKGQPNFHFSAEFEQMISQKLPKSLVSIAGAVNADQGVANSVDQGKILKIPGVIKQTQPSAKTSQGVSPKPLVPPPLPNLNSPVAQKSEPVPAKAKATRKNAPSIAQFMPIAMESDLLSKLQSVLNQGSMAVNS